MTAPEQLVGKDAEVTINGVPVAIGDFGFTINGSEVSQERLSNAFPRNTMGSKKVAIKFTDIDFSGEHLRMAISSTTTAATRTVLSECDVSTNWAVTGTNAANSVITTDSSTYKEGTGCILVTNTGDASGNTVALTVTQDLTGYTLMEAWIKCSNTGTTGANVISYMGLGESAITEQQKAVTVQKAATWQMINWDISGIADASKNAVTKVGFLLGSDSSSNTIRIDSVKAYKGAILGTGQYFDMEVKVKSATDATKYNKIFMPGCFFLNNDLSITGGMDKVIEGPVTVGIKDASKIQQFDS